MADQQSQCDNELFLLEAWVSDNPGSRLYLKLARLYQKNGRMAEAVEVLQRGLAIHPYEVEARGLLAEVLEADGDIPGALQQLKLAASGIKRHLGIFERLASLSEAQGDDESAESARQVVKALGGEPARSQAPASISSEDTLTMADIYANQGHIEQAAAIYQRLLAKNPGRDDIRQKLNNLKAKPPSNPAVSQVLEQLKALKLAALGRSDVH